MRKSWWREWEVWAVVGLVALAYLVPVLRLPVRGEEPRLSQVATDMRRTGDLLVPRQQGTLFLSRPPVFFWTLAGLQALTGSDARWVIRLPGYASVLLVCLLLYAYVRAFASRGAAAAAALIFATFGEMMQIGSAAECDAPFILFVSASLFVWHLGRLRGWPPAAGWIAAYALVALAAMTKGGPQPPVYFLGPVVLYLAVTRDLRSLFHWGHAAGVALAAAMVAGWVVPLVREIGVDNARVLWAGDTSARMLASPWVFARHLVVFPLEVAGSTMPWLPLAGLFLLGPVRARVGRMSRPLLLCVLALGVAFPTCWLPPGGETRYFSPLYPCLAVVLAIAAEAARRAGVGWAGYCRSWALALGGCSVAVLAFGFTRGPLAEPPAAALGLAGGLIALAAVLARVPSFRTAVTAVALGSLLVCAGWMTGCRIRRSHDMEPAIAAVRASVGRPGGLVSLDLIPSVFCYHYGEPIGYVGTPATREEFERAEFFCVTGWGDVTPPLPGPWEQIARVPVERATARTGRVVVIGRPVRRAAARLDTDGPTSR